MKHLRCLSGANKQWVPEQEAEPGTEVLAGDLYLVSPGGTCKKRASRYPVSVKVYRSCFGHYAVLSTSLRAPATYLNLRTCSARQCLPPADSTDSRVGRFRVELGGGEGQVIYFETNPREQRVTPEEWVKAFQGTVTPSPGTISPSLSPVIPRSPIMPTLQESLEEDEEEEELEHMQGHVLSVG